MDPIPVLHLDCGSWEPAREGAAWAGYQIRGRGLCARSRARRPTARAECGRGGTGAAELFLGLFYIRHDDTGVGKRGVSPGCQGLWPPSDHPGPPRLCHRGTEMSLHLVTQPGWIGSQI